MGEDGTGCVMAVDGRRLRKLLAPYSDLPLIGERTAEMRVSIAALASMFTPTDIWFRNIEGVPEGAKLRKMSLDPRQGVLSLLWAHPGFPPPNADGSPYALSMKFMSMRIPPPSPDEVRLPSTDNSNAVTGEADPDALDPRIMDTGTRG
jgi:hypothetical protein